MIRYKQYEIEPQESLYGIRVWIGIYARDIPKFKIFKFLGSSRNTGQPVYFFVERKTRDIFSVTARGLFTPYFHPFLLESNALETYLKFMPL